MDLDLDLGDLPEMPASTAIESVRALTRADLAALGGRSLRETYEPKKITERHHALARAIASGMKDLEAATVVGYDPQMVVMLRRSPAFLELIELYRNEVDTEFSELTARFAGLTKDAMNEIAERLEIEPEKFTNAQLLDLATKMGDRAGFAPVQRSEQTVNISLSEKLALARQRAQRAMIEGNAKDITPENDDE